MPLVLVVGQKYKHYGNRRSCTEMEKAYKLARMQDLAPKIAHEMRISWHISIRGKTAEIPLKQDHLR